MKNYLLFGFIFLLIGIQSCQKDSSADVKKTSVEKPQSTTLNDYEVKKTKVNSIDKENVTDESEISNLEKNGETNALVDSQEKKPTKEIKDKVTSAVKETKEKIVKASKPKKVIKPVEKVIVAEPEQKTEPTSIEEVYEEEEEEETGPAGIMTFKSRSHDFGRIQEGDTFEHEFKFVNTGDAPLVISSIKASCGCTQTTFPKEPILPGEEGAIGVTFDSKSKLGRQKPFMSVVTNGMPKIYSLYMEGVVDTDKR